MSLPGFRRKVMVPAFILLMGYRYERLGCFAKAKGAHSHDNIPRPILKTFSSVFLQIKEYKMSYNNARTIQGSGLGSREASSIIIVALT